MKFFHLFGHQIPCIETKADPQNWFWLKKLLTVWIFWIQFCSSSANSTKKTHTFDDFNSNVTNLICPIFWTFSEFY
jgi:hypothetical protein